MDKRYQPMTSEEQWEARETLYDTLRASPGLSFAETLSLIRGKLRMTYAELSRVTGVSERFLRASEAGEGNPSLETANKVLRPFGLVIGVVYPVKGNGALGP